MGDIKKLRHRCFFDITIADKNVGRIVFELFNDICPKTCDNFRSLCTGEKGLGKTTGKALHYKNVIFHRVVKGFIIQSGDFSMGNGRGGESIFGGTFNDENFILKHEKPFLLSMANRGKNTNGSQFFITLSPAPHLDGVHVVFGHVLSGEQVIHEIQNQTTREDGRPLVDVVISNCGELIPQIKQKEKKKKHKKEKKSDGELDTDEEEKESFKKKKRDKKHKKHKKSKDNKSDENDGSNEEDDKESEQLNANCSVKPEEIPDIPENKFLMRNTEFVSEMEGKRGYPQKSYKYDDKHSSKRKVKGRGPTRYRTPSPNHSNRARSETPEHWRNEQAKTVTLKDIISGKHRDSRDYYHSNSRHEGRRRQRPDSYNRNNNWDRSRRISPGIELKDTNSEVMTTRKRVFTEEPPLNAKNSKQNSSLNSLDQREEQNENKHISYAYDSENMENTEEVIKHSVKSAVKLNVRNRKEDSRERDHKEVRRHQSPLDLKSIPLPDSDPDKKNGQKRDKDRSESNRETYFKRKHRRSSSREKTSRRRRYSNDSN